MDVKVSDLFDIMCIYKYILYIYTVYMLKCSAVAVLVLKSSGIG